MPCRNVVSVDVEDYFHVEAFSGVVSCEAWGQYPCRIEQNTRRLMDLLDICGARGTFFILGWIAERYPGLVREIVARGHEPACHSYWHRLIYRLTAAEFRADTLRAKECIEQAAGQTVRGYRAPSFSLTAKCAWAPEILVELGLEYDSSIYPVRHDIYGLPDAPCQPFRLTTPSGSLTEFPMTTFRMMGAWNFPVAGGGYLRMLPWWYTRMGVERGRKQGVITIAYVHPWELDPEQPHIRAPFKSRLRHYSNLGGMSERLTRLLAMGEFVSFRELRTPADLIDYEIKAEA